MTIINEFKQFALRGTFVDMAVGFTVGAAFSTIAKSLVDDIVMPLIGLVIGKADFSNLYLLLRPGDKAFPPYATLAAAKAAGAVTVNYGAFVNNVIAFVLVSIAMFFVIRLINRLDRRLDLHFGEQKDGAEEEVSKKCPYCLSTIAFRATRCALCTSQLEESSTGATV